MNNGNKLNNTGNLCDNILKSVLTESEYSTLKSIDFDQKFPVENSILQTFIQNTKIQFNQEQYEIFIYLTHKYPTVPPKYFILKILKGLKQYHLEMLEIIIESFLSDYDNYDHFEEEIFRVTNDLSVNDLQKKGITFHKKTRDEENLFSTLVNSLSGLKNALKNYVQISWHNYHYKNKALREGYDITTWDNIMDIL